MDYQTHYLQQKYYQLSKQSSYHIVFKPQKNKPSVKEGYINDLTLKEKTFKQNENNEKIDPRILEVERMAETNYMKQKESEIKQEKQRARECKLQEWRERQDCLKEQLLDLKIQQSQMQYLQDNQKVSNEYYHHNPNLNQNLNQPVYLTFDGYNSQKHNAKYQKNDFSSSLNGRKDFQNYSTGLSQARDSLPYNLTEHQKNNLSASSQSKQKQESISFRNKNSRFDSLNSKQQTTVKLIPLSNTIRNEQFKSMNKSMSIKKSNLSDDLEGEYLNEDFQQGFSKLIIQAKYLISQNNLREAETLLENLMLKIPFNSDCLFLLGETKRIIGKFKEAEILLKKSIQQENYSPFVYKSLAETYYATQKYQESAFFLKKYLLFKKDDDEALSILGLSLIKIGENLEASVCFNKALELNQQKLEYYLYRSEVNELLGLRELSQRDYAYFIQNKFEYLQKLSMQSQKLKNTGKLQESQKTQELFHQLIPIN